MSRPRKQGAFIKHVLKTLIEKITKYFNILISGISLRIKSVLPMYNRGTGFIGGSDQNV